MSTVTITGVSPNPTIYDDYALAKAYIGAMYGDTYTAWLALDADDQARTLVAAARYIDQQVWVDEAGTFDLRNAIDAFRSASYELAVLIADDPEILTVFDAGSNIQKVDAGGAGVTYFNPTSAVGGSATLLPPVLQRLIGGYLATSALGTPGADGCGTSSTSPFSDCVDYDRNEPY